MIRADVVKYVILTIAILWTVFSAYGGYSTFVSNHYDDSLISYRYAINLVEGNGLVFNEGEKCDAASSFLYTVILAVFYKLGAHDLELVSGLISILSLLSIGILVYNLSKYIIDSTIISLSMAYLVSVHGFMSGWATSGMETTFYTALLLLFVGVTFIWESRPRLSFFLLVLLVLTRHDSVMIIPFWALIEVKNRRYEHCLIFLAVFVVYYGLRFWYYGVLIPHAVQAKQVMIYYQPNPIETINYWFQFASPALFLALGVISDDTRRRQRLAGMFIVLALIVYAFGPRVDWIRYSVPLLPVVGILAMRTIKRLYYYLNYETALIIAFFIFFSYSTYNSITHYRGKILGYKTDQEARISIGDYIAKEIATDKLIISGDIGAISYKAINHKFIDLIGLTSPEVLYRYQNQKSLDGYLKSVNPGYVADTFAIKGNGIHYERFKASKFIKGGIDSECPDLKLRCYRETGKNYIIALCEM